MVKPHLHLQPRHLDQLCAFPTSRPLSFFSFCVVSLMSVTRIGNRPCDPQRQRERGGLHQRAERSGWAAGIRLGRWRSLRALGRIAGILHRLTLRGPFSFDFSFPGQTSAITSSEHFYPFLYGTYLVRLLTLPFNPALLYPAHFLSPRWTGKNELWLLCETLSKSHDISEFVSLSVKWIMTLTRLPEMVVVGLKWDNGSFRHVHQ